jgi:hypothetical protein
VSLKIKKKSSKELHALNPSLYVIREMHPCRLLERWWEEKCMKSFGGETQRKEAL